MTAKNRRPDPKPTSQQRADYQRVREMFRNWHPSREELIAIGDIDPTATLTLGEWFDLRQLIAKLREERKRSRITLGQLARQTSIDKATLSRLENGKHPNPTLATILRYADAIGKKVVLTLVDQAPHR